MGLLDSFFGLPVGAGVRDYWSGSVDGSPIYTTPSGQRYYHQYEEPKPIVPFDVLTTTVDSEGRAIHDRTPQEPNPVLGLLGQIGNAMTQGITAPGRALRGEPVTYGDAWATALDWGALSAPMEAPAGALRAGAGRTAPEGIRAYHGSPHDFDRFSMDAIGTGEGAQAYGHGLYFAESEDVARGYRDALTPKRSNAFAMAEKLYEREGVPDAVRQRAYDIAASSGSEGQIFEFLDSVDPKLSDWMRDQTQGRMYEVNINANPDDFLDWDAFPDEQTPKAIAYLKEKLGFVPDQSGKMSLGFRDSALHEGTGKYPPLSGPSKMVTDELRDAGIPGIKYRDGFSRGAEGGTRNYVVFDENLISIVRKYGIAGAAAYLGIPESDLRAQIQQGGM